MSVEWQPSKTAPKDGTTIILWHGDSGLRDRVVVGAYDKRAKHPWRFLNNPFPLKGYPHDGGGDGMANAFLTAPTHWMPLPKPPPALAPDGSPGIPHNPDATDTLRQTRA